MPTCASARNSPTSRIRTSATRARAPAEIRAQVARLKEKALAAGGLYVLGTERHESRRIDNQLRGRSGRQGDPGHSKFFLSLEDDLMRIFGTDKLDGMLTKLGLKENEAIIHPWINKALEKAQQKVEARNFDIRKNILKFDNVMNDQRKVIFDQRVEWMQDETVAEVGRRHAPQRDRRSGRQACAGKRLSGTMGYRGPAARSSTRVLGLDLPVDEWAKEEGIADEEIFARVERRADEHMAAKVAQWGPDVIRYVEKSILLQTLDHLWREHLVMLDHLRQVIGLRGYGQRDPLNEYKAEAFSLFEAMSQSLREARDGAADARRDRAGSRRSSSRRALPAWRRTRSIRPPARTRWRWRWPAPRRWRATVSAPAPDGAARSAPSAAAVRGRNAPARSAPERNPQDPHELGQGRPQRGLSLRLGQEVQALPRPLRLDRIV